jgi:predicted amidohydrolase
VTNKKLLRVGLASDVPSLLSPGGLQLAKTSDIIILPELHDGGYGALHNRMHPHQWNDPLLTQLRLTSLQIPAYLVAGSMFLRSGRKNTNTSLVFKSGRIVHRYDKVHLFQPTGDGAFFSPGSAAGTFLVRRGTSSVRAGIAICYDLRFPELIRRMVFKRMSILLIPARWPLSRDEAWSTLLKARAIENHIFVLGCNATGNEGGNSYVFDPLGKLVGKWRLTVKQPVAGCKLDLSKLEESRKMHDSVKEARLRKIE